VASSQEILKDVNSESALPAINDQNISKISAIMHVKKMEKQVDDQIENGG